MWLGFNGFVGTNCGLRGDFMLICTKVVCEFIKIQKCINVTCNLITIGFSFIPFNNHNYFFSPFKGGGKILNQIDADWKDEALRTFSACFQDIKRHTGILLSTWTSTYNCPTLKPQWLLCSNTILTVFRNYKNAERFNSSHNVCAINMHT